MRPEDRRRLGALAALVLGVFGGLTLVPSVPTGPVGRLLGEALWRILGGGAVGLPLLGFGLALAGFDRVPRLDMKRMGFLLGGVGPLPPLPVRLIHRLAPGAAPPLPPFTVGVTTAGPAAAFDPPLSEWGPAARLTGLVPGFAARGVTD